MTGYIALTETSRDELRERINHARHRFDRLVRTADPRARPSGSRWTVQEIAAHVLTVGHRYREMANGRMYRRAATPREVDVINQDELHAAMAPVPELADQLLALAPQIDRLFDEITNKGPEIPFHADGLVDGITAQTNWLGELLLHGEDVARAVRARWEFAERDMLLIARGLMQIVPYYLHAGVSADTDVCVRLNLPQARPYLIHIHHGAAEARPPQPGDRPDAVLRLPASTLTPLLYQRIGPLKAARRGLLIVGGRRPWVALRLQSYFERG